ncbi:hypothetical protein BH10PSE19_BH10PSE19_14880 [soil metagenome]
MPTYHHIPLRIVAAARISPEKALAQITSRAKCIKSEDEKGWNEVDTYCQSLSSGKASRPRHLYLFKEEGAEHPLYLINPYEGVEALAALKSKLVLYKMTVRDYESFFKPKSTVKLVQIEAEHNAVWGYAVADGLWQGGTFAASYDSETNNYLNTLFSGITDQTVSTGLLPLLITTLVLFVEYGRQKNALKTKLGHEPSDADLSMLRKAAAATAFKVFVSMVGYSLATKLVPVVLSVLGITNPFGWTALIAAGVTYGFIEAATVVLAEIALRKPGEPINYAKLVKTFAAVFFSGMVYSILSQVPGILFVKEGLDAVCKGVLEIAASITTLLFSAGIFKLLNSSLNKQPAFVRPSRASHPSHAVELTSTTPAPVSRSSIASEHSAGMAERDDKSIERGPLPARAGSPTPREAPNLSSAPTRARMGEGVPSSGIRSSATTFQPEQKPKSSMAWKVAETIGGGLQVVGGAAMDTLKFWSGR